jgi:hypothetical protein
MTKKLIRDLIQISISQSDPQQVRIAQYLRNTGKITSQLMEAVVAYWDSIAISEDPNSSEEDVELALLESLNKLHSQMFRLVDYHRVKRKIQVPSETLTRLGLLPIQGYALPSPISVQPSTSNSMSIVNCDSIESNSLATFLPVNSDGEDEDDNWDNDIVLTDVGFDLGLD